MSRRTQVVLLCEDNQHHAFTRRFLKLCGYDPRRMTVIKSPKGRGSGEQWVREQYAREVQALRQAPHITGRALIVMLDEDTHATRGRADALADALGEARLSPRASAERIVHAIPARNIETWLAYLDGQTVDATSTYPKLRHERDCQPMIQALKAMCDDGALRDPPPPSLATACVEFRERMP